MEDVATVKVAFQEKTSANAISYLTVQYGCISTAITCLLPPPFSDPYLVYDHCNKLAGCG